MSKTDDARQRKLEDALREGFVARRDKQPRESNAYDRPSLRKQAAKLMHDADDSKRAAPYSPRQQELWVEDRYTEGRCGTRTCWDEGWFMADEIARSQGEARLMEIPLQTVRSKSTTLLKFDQHPALFGEEEAPYVKPSRAPREYRERKALAEFEGRTLAPQLADEQA